MSVPAVRTVRGRVAFFRKGCKKFPLLTGLGKARFTNRFLFGLYCGLKEPTDLPGEMQNHKISQTS